MIKARIGDDHSERRRFSRVPVELDARVRELGASGIEARIIVRSSLVLEIRHGDGLPAGWQRHVAVDRDHCGLRVSRVGVAMCRVRDPPPVKDR